MLGSADLDAFVANPYLAIITTRKDGSLPHRWGYRRDADSLLFSAQVDRLRGRTLARDPRAAICVIKANEPNAFVSVEGTVTIHRDDPSDLRERMLLHLERIMDLFPEGALALAVRDPVAQVYAGSGAPVTR